MTDMQTIACSELEHADCLGYIMPLVYSSSRPCQCPCHEGLNARPRDFETSQRRAAASFYAVPDEQSDTQAALDLAATRWDNTRGYVADLLGQARADRENAASDSIRWIDAYAREQVLEAVASFMDGQHDGSVTRG